VPARAVLFDVDGTLIDVLEGQRRVWHAWAVAQSLDPLEVYAVAQWTRPEETFATVAPGRDVRRCLELLHAIEDQDALEHTPRAFPGASALLSVLPPDGWALVTSNYEERVRARFERLCLPLPSVIVDARSVKRGKPNPEPYELAAQRLGVERTGCLAVEDSDVGVASAVAAGMTVWTVNTNSAPHGGHRHFATLEEAKADILRWVRRLSAADVAS
jgi:sugar-phosphatase